MTVAVTRVYQLVCDRCGTDHDPIPAPAEDRDEAVEQARRQGWLITGEVDLCAVCCSVLEMHMRLDAPATLDPAAVQSHL